MLSHQTLLHILQNDCAMNRKRTDTVGDAVPQFIHIYRYTEITAGFSTRNSPTYFGLNKTYANNKESGGT